MFILVDSTYYPGKIQCAVFRRSEFCLFQRRFPAHHYLRSFQQYRMDSILQRFVLLLDTY